MPIEVAPSRYVTIVNTLQERILDGTYPQGMKIPSETELMGEFGVSRPTVTRALNLLSHDGWLDAQHGRGRFVLGPPARDARQGAAHVAAMLDRAEATTGQVSVKVVKAGPVMAPERAAYALGIEAGTPVIARQRLVTSKEIGPIELSTAYVPVELAVGSGVSKSAPIPGGLLAHLAKQHPVDFDHATERIAARMPTADEAELLQITRRDPLLTVLVSVHDHEGMPQLALDVLLVGTRFELEESYPLP